MPTVHLLDYVAGNVRSLANAIEKLGYTIAWIEEPKDIESAEASNKYSCHNGDNTETPTSNEELIICD